ncbi:unnamed protein product [Linum trigynum]|uniref:KIB1-4 beta-propeller domain-containing protein n=1 Tax=Linum trigynum TaxID=586398 RepID=A0AAV2CPQ4_9ROSI
MPRLPRHRVPSLRRRGRGGGKKNNNNSNKKHSITHINLANKDYGTNVHCHGSAFGWLLLEERPRKPRPSVALHLLNPFTRKKIPLPAEIRQVGGYLLDSGKPREVRRFALSADPSTEESVVVVLCYGEKVSDEVYWGFDGGLAFFKLGGRGGIDQRWTLVTFNPFEAQRCNLGSSSVVFWRDKMHVLSPADGRVLAIDDDLDGQGDDESMFSLAFLSENSTLVGRFGYRSCLVVSPEGELMLLNFSVNSNRFDIYKMNEDEKIWNEVETIGDYALFYNSQSAIYVCVKDHPAYRNNCVYFRQDVYDLGISLLGDCQDNRGHFGDWIFPCLL